jgi:hypothetical protein
MPLVKYDVPAPEVHMKKIRAPEDLLIAQRTAKHASVDGKPPIERRQFLSYMVPKMIIDLKTAAMEDGKPAYVLVEEAVDAYLKARKPKR